jgi:hypothetical protein
MLAQQNCGRQEKNEAASFPETEITDPPHRNQGKKRVFILR